MHLSILAEVNVVHWSILSMPLTLLNTIKIYQISAEHFHYTVDNNRDLIAFLKQIDANLLTKRTYQEFHYPGFGRLMANLIWSPIVERMQHT